MTYQAYLDAIAAKTGKSPAEFEALARERGLLEPGVKAGAVVAWLKDDYGLGHGHAMALYGAIRSGGEAAPTLEDAVARHFAGARSARRPAFDELIASAQAFGPDVSLQAGKSYLTLLRAGKKFAIVQVTAARLDVGIKLKGVPPTDRLEPAGKWNSMVTHRVRLDAASEVDDELVRWLRDAYDRA